jgi:hypothetical protein
MAKRKHRETQLGEAYWDAVYAAMEELSEKLECETSRCEQLTADAIRAAQPARKLSALDSGIEQWKKALCNSAVWYYHTSFKLVLNNSASRDQKSPGDVAYDDTVSVLSVFLRVNALDGEVERSDGRVRDFIRHACGDWRDVVDLLGDSGPFQLPSWAERRGFGAKLAGWPTPSQNPNHTLSSEYAERFIRDAQAKVTEGLLSALFRARREARIATGMRASSSLTEKLTPPYSDQNLNQLDPVNKKLASDPGGSIRYSEAAAHYDCTTKTIRQWIVKRKLFAGAKRGFVTNASIIELDKKIQSGRLRRPRMSSH